MAYNPVDATTAKALLEDAIASDTEPLLTPSQVTRALGLASSLDGDGNVVYLPAALNRAAAWAWGVKAGMAAALVDVGGGNGVYLKEGSTQDYCLRMQAAYRSGAMSVVSDGIRSGSGWGSVPVIGAMAAEDGEMVW